jgi:hypothetical protein
MTEAPKKKKKSKADEVAEAMAANMAANMKDPNFLRDRELMKDDVRRKIIEERKDREKKNE